MKHDYHSPDGSIHATAIKAGRVSMLHMRAVMQREPSKDTDSMRFGRLVHLAVLEPRKMHKLPTWRGSRRGTKEWDEFRVCNPGEYVTPDERDDLERIVASVTRNVPTYLISRARREVVCRWKDALVGKCKARLDGLTKDGCLLEVKSAKDVRPREFMRQAFNLGYHLQLGWYAHGVAARKNGQPVKDLYVIAIESSSPFDCVVYRVSDEIIKQGYEEAYEIARRYRVCEAVRQFDGIAESGKILDYELPEWACGKSERDITAGTMEASEL